jgi:hypothetical protein
VLELLGDPTFKTEFNAALALKQALALPLLSTSSAPTRS